MLHRQKLNTLIIAMVVSLVAATASYAAETWKIGGIFSSTGRASFLGDPEMKTMEMVIEQINKNGGIDGHQLEAVIYDSEGSPQKAVSAINKLIHRDKVLAIIGPSTTPTTLAVVNFAEKAKIPLISCAAGVKITQPVKPWVFKTAQSDLLAVAAVYRQMQKAGIKTVGILTVANSFGESGKHQLESQASQYGINVVRSESFGAKDSDMTAQLTKIRSASPDAVICWGTNPGPAVVAKNARQLNMTTPLYQSHGVASPKFIELAGAASEGIILPSGKILVSDLLADSDLQKKTLENYAGRYRERWGKDVSGFGGYAYDAVNILAEALRGSGGDRNKIRSALETMKNHVGVSGVFNYSAKDHNGLSPEAFVMVKIKDGKWELLK